MARPALTRPTDAELAILRILWARGPLTVRDVHEELNRTRPPGYDRPVGYTSVLKVMQIMTDKGLVSRDESNRTHVYRAAAAQEPTLTRLVADLMDRAFGGSARAMILHALSANPSSPEELAQIRRLVDEFQARLRPPAPAPPPTPQPSQPRTSRKSRQGGNP